MTAMPRPSFTLTVEAGPETASLRLAGDLDYDTADEILQYAENCIAELSGMRDLYLDCAQLRACDSMGVSTLIQIHRSSTARDVRLHLENPPPFLERILRLTGIRHLFAIDGQESQHGQAQQPHADELSARAKNPLHASPPSAPTV
ncbi:STAS domain-containing protein [Streptomyces sp. OR43]|uniref:STAS domain-containing protein n=1 Tax=Streptomyces sp. or43 TaxID=2478957 RepID=UPI0011CE8046|nr:STAS domain-containing protein [Streptomyces sp. or43]TXS42042.1 anti-sigma factor antagonist [Streptomyces sp. or43]